MLDWIWCVHFCDNIYLSKFCRKLYWFWFSAFRNSWMKIFSKDFCTFTGVYVAIYMGPCRRSYILLVQKFRTSEMLDKWSPTSKVSVIKLSHYPHGQYNFWLVREPTCPLYLLPCVLIHCVKSSYSELFWSAFSRIWTEYGEIWSSKFPEISSGTGWINLGATPWVWTWDPWIGNRPYSLSRENAIFATLITPSEKSNDSYILVSYGDFS